MVYIYAIYLWYIYVVYANSAPPSLTGGMFARRAPGSYLSITYPDFSPRFTLLWRRAPK